MAVFKCKMCGGDMEVAAGESVVTCTYCGTKQTLPRLDDERRANLYDRANHFRRNNEFDKAASIYEKVLTEDTTDAEAYWSLVLCRYGIEYVEDPVTHKRVPTVNRAQFTSVFDDDNYKSALENADSYQRDIYKEEANAINEIQKGILSISQKEEPFDVFICYKETDANGRRTPDSVLANDLYHQLTQEGFKVFFSRITLEDKLGTAYEPYIFAALNSAKVMVVLGTKPEYFNAVWVKNEWSRFLSLVKASGGKKVLIPAYKDMDPYDLPEEFSHLQAQDMSKLGFMQDLIRGIKKIAQTNEPKATVVKETVVASGNANIAPLLKRAFMFLEDGNWQEADEYCEKVLDQDPENVQAYLGKLMAESRVRKQCDLKDCAQPFDTNSNYQKVLRFGDEKLKAELAGYLQFINERNEQARMEEIYQKAFSVMHMEESPESFQSDVSIFQAISGYKEAIQLFESISGWKNADELIEVCKTKIEEFNQRVEASREEKERRAEQKRIATEKAAKKRKTVIAIITSIVIACIAFLIVLTTVIIPNGKYNDAVDLYNAGKYDEAITAFEALNGYKDSESQITKCEAAIKDAKYNDAVDLYNAGKYDEAITAFKALNGYKDSVAQITKCETAINDVKYNDAVDLYNAGKYDEAITAFEALNGYKDSELQIVKCETAINDAKYNDALDLYNAKNYEDAYTAFISLNYKDSADKATECLFLKQKEGLRNVTVGSTVGFGFYEQDNNTSNGKEEIEWKVLAVEGNKALVISQYALDCQQYNTSNTSTTWENCTLRTWLNETFYNAAFESDHQKMIASSIVTADKNPSYSTSPGNNTIDKVFLLSITEVNNYFSSDSARQCQNTAYCYAQGAHKASNGNCLWWLRSPGYYSNYATYVRNDGSVYSSGGDVHSSNGAVRPAMWINLS